MALFGVPEMSFKKLWELWVKLTGLHHLGPKKVAVYME